MTRTKRRMLVLLVTSVATFLIFPDLPAWASCGKAYFSPQSYFVDENDGHVTLTILLLRDYPESRTRTIGYQTKTGTAKGGVDYVTETGSVIFPPEATAKTFQIDILNDSTHESAERFEVLVKPGPTNGCVESGADASVTIDDDDPKPEASPSRDGGSDPPPESELDPTSGSAVDPVSSEPPIPVSPTASPTGSEPTPSPKAADFFDWVPGGDGGGLTGIALAGIAVGSAIMVGSAAALFVRRRFPVSRPPR